jgi:hypothetical protein
MIRSHEFKEMTKYYDNNVYWYPGCEKSRYYDVIRLDEVLYSWIKYKGPYSCPHSLVIFNFLRHKMGFLEKVEALLGDKLEPITYNGPIRIPDDRKEDYTWW